MNVGFAIEPENGPGGGGGIGGHRRYAIDAPRGRQRDVVDDESGVH